MPLITPKHNQEETPARGRVSCPCASGRSGVHAPPGVTVSGWPPSVRATQFDVGAGMFLVQDNDRKRRQRRKRQHDLGAVAAVARMASVMLIAMVAMTVVMTMVVTAIAVPVMAIVVAACVVRAPVAAIVMPPI